MSEENQRTGTALRDIEAGSLLTPEEVEFVHNRVVEAFTGYYRTGQGFPVVHTTGAQQESEEWINSGELDEMMARSRAVVGVDDVYQHRIEIDTENWPENAIASINIGRATLQARGFVGMEPMLVGTTQIVRTLDSLIGNTGITYRQALMENGLLSRIHELEGNESRAMLIVDAEINARIPVINREFNLTWRNRATTPPKPKFSEEVVDAAWKLLEEYMTKEQYFAFMEGDKIELLSKDESYRLILDKNGEFMVLAGRPGIVSLSGRIRSYDYPLGDEIAAFLDWFRYKTEELISQWNCGTYGIVKEGQRR